jgi:kynurenine--oxoglutarate transaminase/cysteine-S-conjugate beta-lyase/glutamine--phenylpyruvate transaminase
MLSISRIVSDDAGPGCVVISDEVYKYIVHSPPVDDGGGGGGIGNGGTTSSCPGHVHFASLPGMWDRTITVSSAGKTFSATGWQVGWCVGPSRLISPVHSLLPYVQFCASTVMQEALARTLPRADEPYMGYGSYYGYLNEKYRRKRDMLATALRDAGFEVPDYENDPGWGGFFIFARITDRVRRALPLSRLEAPYRANPAAPGGTARLDWALCQWMAEEVGVLCIPAGPFFSRERATEGASDEFIRVAFCKTDETIEQAAVALRGLTSSLAGGGSDYDEDEEEEEEDANIASGKEAAAEASLVDEDVVMNRMG